MPAIEAVRDAGITTALLYEPALNVHQSLLASSDERIRLGKGILEEHERPDLPLHAPDARVVPVDV